MDAIPFEGCNAEVAKNQAEYRTLPAIVGPVPVCDCPVCIGQPEARANCPQCSGAGLLYGIGMTCCFQLTPEEIAEINKTGKLWSVLVTFGGQPQPQLISTTKPAWIS